MFKTSSLPQTEELKKFLTDKLANPYNKYCLDCKKNTTTHCIIWLGIFLCKDCAEMHRTKFGGNQYSLVKDVFNEQWDDYQLRSVCFGGNQALFNLLKEYQVDNLPLESKYRHSSVSWYRKRHIALMDGVDFDLHKPAKDWDERLAMTKSQLFKTSEALKHNLGFAGSDIKEKGAYAGQEIKHRASIAGAVI